MRHIRHILFITLLALLFASPVRADVSLPGELLIIGEQAFLNDTSLTGKLIIPEGVTEIGAEAFKGCTGITSVVIPDSVVTIGAEAFSGCTNLTVDLLLRYHVTVGDGCFDGVNGRVRQETHADQFSYQIVDDSYVRITALNDATYSGELIIPEYIEGYPVQELGSYLQLYGSVWNGWMWVNVPCCITSVHLPDTIRTIASHAFVNFNTMTSIVLPDGITSIGASAFLNCTGLTSVDLPDGLTNVSDNLFQNCSGLSRVDMHEGIQSIGPHAFGACSNLTSIELPDGLVSIGHDAFDGCGALTSIVIPGSVTSIGARAFGYCDSLKRVVFEDGISRIDGEQMFYLCELETLVIPDSVTHIGANTFSWCGSRQVNAESLEGWLGITFEGEFSNPVVDLDGEVLINGVALTHIQIPEGMTELNDYALCGFKQLVEISLPDSLTRIGDYAFYRCSSLRSIVLPEGVTYVGEHAFSDCSSLASAYIPDSITSISASVFSYCSSLESVVIPDSVTSISRFAFLHCSSLASVDMPDSVISIDEYAFSNCSSLASVVIPDGVTSIQECTFMSCSGLTSVIIPDGVTSIGRLAFSDCRSLTSIVIPDGVTSIGNSAFSSCSSLASVVIPDSVTSIADNAFLYCSGLKSVAIPDSVTSIGVQSFSGCHSLVSVTLSNNLSTIGDLAFSGCDSLMEYRYSLHSTTAKTMRGINNPVFYDSAWQCKFRYAGSTSDDLHLIAYDHSNAVPVLPDGIVLIGENAFSRTGITSITIPETVTSIGKYAFNGCTSLTSVIFPEVPITLEAYAFAGTGLTGHLVFLTGSVIDPNAFYGCTGLTYGVFTEDERVEYVTREYLVYLMDNAQSPDTLIGNMEAEENSDWFEQFIYDAVDFVQGNYDGILLSSQNKRMYLFHEALAVNSSTPEAEFIPTNSRIALESAATVWKEGTELTNQHLFDTVVTMCDEVFLTDIESADVADAFKMFYTKPDGADEVFTYLVSEGLKPEAAEDVIEAFDFLSSFRLFAMGLEGVTSVYESLVELYNDLQFLKALDRNSLLVTARIYRASNDSVMREVGDVLWIVATQDESEIAWYLATGHFVDFGLRTIVNKLLEKAMDVLLKPYTAVAKITNAFLNAFTHVGEVPGLVHDLSFAADAAEGTWYVFQNRLAAYHANPTEENLNEAYHAYIVYLTELKKSQSAFIKLKKDMDSAAFVGMSPVTAQIVEMAEQQLSHLDNWLYRARTIYRLRYEGTTYEEMRKTLEEWSAQ